MVRDGNVKKIWTVVFVEGSWLANVHIVHCVCNLCHGTSMMFVILTLLPHLHSYKHTLPTLLTTLPNKYIICCIFNTCSLLLSLHFVFAEGRPWTFVSFLAQPRTRKCQWADVWSSNVQVCFAILPSRLPLLMQPHLHPSYMVRKKNIDATHSAA